MSVQSRITIAIWTGKQIAQLYVQDLTYRDEVSGRDSGGAGFIFCNHLLRRGQSRT
jgi:hypothetical protein